MTTPSMQLRMDLEAMESELIQESTQASNDGALLHLGEQTTTPIAQAMLGTVTAVVELIPISATVSHDGECNNECVIHYEGTTDAAQPVPPSPGMDSDPYATIESSTVLLSKEIVVEDTSRVIHAAPRDSVEQGAHIASEKDTAMPVVSVAIFLARTNFNTKTRTGLLETNDDNAINLDLNADTIIPDRIYLKRWKDPDKAGARHNKVKEELESAKCCSIEFSRRLCSDKAEVIPNTPGTLGVAGVAAAQLLGRDAVVVRFPAGSGWSDTVRSGAPRPTSES